MTQLYGYAEGDQLPWDNTNGLYVWRDVLPGYGLKNIFLFLRQNGYDFVEPFANLHCTVVYSKATPSDPDSIYLSQEPIKCLVTGVDIFGSEDKVLVLTVKNPALNASFDRSMKAGCSFDYPEYQPHVTLGKLQNQPDLDRLRSFLIENPVTIELGAEKAANLKNTSESAVAACWSEDHYYQHVSNRDAGLTEETASGNESKDFTTVAAQYNFERKSVNAFLICCCCFWGYWESNVEAYFTKQERATIEKGWPLCKPFFAEIGLLKEHKRLERALALKTDEDLADAFSYLIDEVNDVLKGVRIRAATGLSPDQEAFLVNILRWQSVDSDSARKQIILKHPFLGNPTVNQSIARIQEESLPITKKTSTNNEQEIRSLVKQLGGKFYVQHLTLNEINSLRENGTEEQKALLEKYKKLIKEDGAKYKEEVSRLVGMSGKSTMDVKDVVKHCTSVGIIRTNIPEGFEGRIDPSGKLYTKSGVLLKSAPTCPAVIMNENWSADNDTVYYCQGAWADAIKASTLKVAPTYYFSIDAERARSERKVNKIEHVTSIIDKVSTAWVRLTKSKKPIDKLLGFFLEFLYRTSQRVGSGETFSKGGQTFGASTFLVKHVKVLSNQVKIKYPSKSDGIANFVFSRTETEPRIKHLVEFLVQLVEDKEPEDPVWQLDDVTLNYTKINSFLKTYGISSHIFRSLNGTNLAEKELEKFNLVKPDQNKLDDLQYSKALVAYQKEVEVFYLQSMEKVGSLLGHFSADKVIGTTAIKSYVSVQVTRDFFKNAGVKMPAKIARIINE